jgi:glycosyltransferase involved in cell wall biosynthesis
VTTVHVVVPDGIDDPTQPSGGNTYDRQICRGLRAIAWSVEERAVTGSWPRPDADALSGLDSVLARIPDDGLVLIDGLVASVAPGVLRPHAQRLRLVVLVHMPLGSAREAEALATATAVVTTSAWARRRLLDLYALPHGRVHVAEPGVEPAALVAGTRPGSELLCVAAVTRVKGHDILLAALADLSDVPWRCVCVGSLDREPVFAEALRAHELNGRVAFPGPLTGSDLDAAYAAADLLVLPSRAETYGMVVTEALSRGLPVVAAAVGGVAEALGTGASGSRPGLLVPPDDPAALGAALREWLTDASLRERLRRAARERRESLEGWSTTSKVIADVLAEVAV